MNQELETLLGTKVYWSRVKRGQDTLTTINGGRVLQADTKADNGTLQVLDRILVPNVHATVKQGLAANATVTLFYQALKLSGLLETLTGSTGYTVFAPNNDAVKRYGYASLEAIEQVDPAVLKTWLSYHIAKERKFAQDYFLLTPAGNTSYTEQMLNDKTVTVNLLAEYNVPNSFTGITLKGAANPSAIAPVKTDIVTGMIMAFFLLFCAPVATLAQETSGALTGRVTDAGAEALPGVSIIAVHTPSGTKYSLSTDKDGRFTINNMRTGGPYRVSASMVGMQTDTREDIYLRLGVAQQLLFVLSSSAQTMSEVTITAHARKPSANTYGTGKNISAEQIRNMPSVSRSITDLTRSTPQGSRDNSFGGTNFRYNNVTIDGAVNNDAIGFSPSLGGQTGTSGMNGSST
eukprot:gene17883-21365_t